MNPFAGLLTGGSQAAPASAAPSSTSSNRFAGILTGKAPISSQAAPTAPATAPTSPVQPVSTPGSTIPAPAGASFPASAFRGSIGSGYGASNITDVPDLTNSKGQSVPSKPLLTYENPEAKASQLLSDRVAPSFDPTVAQKIDPSILQNGRMPTSVSEAIRKSIGATAFQELDHIMPLELGGSNEKSNLRPETAANAGSTYNPSSNPTPTDPLENALAASVHKGDISLVDAWKQMAKTKGLTLPEQGGPVLNINETQNDKDVDNSLLGKAATFIRNAFTPQTENKVFNELGGNAIVHPLQTLNTIVGNAKQGIDASLTNLVSSGKAIFAPNQNAAQHTASVLNFLTAAASTAMLPVSETFNIASQLPVVKPAADATGLIFDKAGQLTGFAANKLLDTLPLSQQTKDTLAQPVQSIGSLAGQVILGGYIFGKASGLMDAKGEITPEDEKAIVNDAQAKAQEINNAPELAKTPEVSPETTPKETPTPEPSTEAPKAQTPEPQAVKVSRAQLPVGTGDQKVSGLESRMKASLDNLSDDDKANISNYNEMKDDNQLKAAAKYVSENPDEALEVLKGNKPAPKGLLINSIFIALQAEEGPDNDLAIKLASLHSTRMGQEIHILRHANPYAPDNFIRPIQESRIEALGRERVKTMINKEVEANAPKLSRSISAGRAYSRMTLDQFIDHITC